MKTAMNSKRRKSNGAPSRFVQTTLTRTLLPTSMADRVVIAEKVSGEAESCDALRFFEYAAEADARRRPLDRYEVVPRVNAVSRAMFHLTGDEEAITDAATAAVRTCVERGWGGTKATVLRRGTRSARVVVDAKCPSLAVAASALRANTSHINVKVADVPNESAGVFCDDNKVDSPYYIIAPFCGKPPFVPIGGRDLFEGDRRTIFVTCPV